jgi:hypothetical protein
MKAEEAKECVCSVEDIETSQIFGINNHFYVMKSSVEVPKVAWDTNLLFL